MDWKSRIRWAFTDAGVQIDDEVLDELADHASAAYDRESSRESTLDATAVVDALIASWVAEANHLQRRRARQPAVTSPPAGAGLLSGAMQDVRYGIRLLCREPGATAAAVATIALAIAATTTLFSITYGTLLRPLPWSEPDRLVRLEERRGGLPGRLPWTISNATYRALEGSSTIEEIGGWVSVPMTLRASGEAERIPAARVTAGMLAVVRARPVAGRLLFSGGDTPSDDNAVLVSLGLAERHYGSAEAAVGQLVRFDAQPRTIVGVMPREFAFPDLETQVWVRQAVPPVTSDGGRSTSVAIFSVLARMRSGVTPEQVSAEATSRARSGESLGPAALGLFGSDGEVTIEAQPALDVLVHEVRPAIVILFAAVVLLFGTAVASVAMVQMARATRRRREMTVRAALGAGTARLTRQWLVENALIAAAGGIAGALSAAAAHELLPSLLPADFPRLTSIALDWRVALFATAATALSAVLCGIAPSLQTSRIDLARSLADEGTAPAGGSLRTPAARSRAVIMIGQVAVACVLMVGAGLLGRSLLALVNVDRGYDPHNLLTVRLVAPARTNFAASRPVLDLIQTRLKSIAGVEDVAVGNALPLVTAGNFSGITLPSPLDGSVEIQVQALHRSVSPAYFSTMRLRLLAGRHLSDTDTEDSRSVLVVNRTFAERYLGADPVGRILEFSMWGRRNWEVVGVIEDMQQGGVQGAAPSESLATPQPEMFSSYRQVTELFVPTVMLVVRTADDPVRFVPMVRSLVREQAPSFVIDSVMTMEDRVRASLAKPRTYAALLVAFAVFALTIAATGLFGVLSFTVAQRTREIGVRTALGAGPRDIVRLVLGQGSLIVVAGLAVGLVTAFFAAESLSKLLYGVSSRDPVTFIAAPAIIVLIAAVACFVPARRAAQIDPLTALRL
jgi:predicted permease